MLTHKLCDRLLRAYGLAYVSTTAPRLLNLLLVLYRKKLARSNVFSSVSAGFSFLSVVRRVVITRRLHAMRCLKAVPNTQKDLLIRTFRNRYSPCWQDLLLFVDFPPFVRLWWVAILSYSGRYAYCLTMRLSLAWAKRLHHNACAIGAKRHLASWLRRSQLGSAWKY